jgi:hypothetical protein
LHGTGGHCKRGRQEAQTEMEGGADLRRD